MTAPLDDDDSTARYHSCEAAGCESLNPDNLTVSLEPTTVNPVQKFLCQKMILWCQMHMMLCSASCRPCHRAALPLACSCSHHLTDMTDLEP
jgi:hypothetical protein